MNLTTKQVPALLVGFDHIVAAVAEALESHPSPNLTASVQGEHVEHMA